VTNIFCKYVDKCLNHLTCNSEWSGGLSRFQSRLSSASKRCSCTCRLNSSLCNGGGVQVALGSEWAALGGPRYNEPSFTMLSTKCTRGLPFSYCKQNHNQTMCPSRSAFQGAYRQIQVDRLLLDSKKYVNTIIFSFTTYSFY
jgi:hypothetical protein